MPASDALTVRTQVTEQLDGQSFRQMIDTYVRIEHEENPTRWAMNSRHFGSESFANAIRAAETFYLSPDMQALATMASEDFPLDEAVLRNDLPSDVGFMYLPQRFRMLEMRGRVMVIHAVLWSKENMWLLTDRTDPDDEISQRMREQNLGYESLRHLGRWDITAMIRFNFGQPIPQDFTFDLNVLPPEAKVKFIEGPDGQIAMHTDHVLDITKPPTSKPDPFMRLMLAVWRLMQQTLADVSEIFDHPKPTKRYAERAHVPMGVTVISLRRTEYKSSGTGHPINYRTPVRGHWRKVWCGPLNGERYQRAVYIHPFWRGPEGAPIIIRQRVNALVR